jgi:acetyltransferase-like isoleucine patch superfamily enzyme
MPIATPEQRRAATAADRVLTRLFAGQAGRRLAGLLPERWTVLRHGPGQTPPAPRAFAAFGEGSWIVPPATIEGADQIEIGDGVIVMEQSSLVATGRLVIGSGARLARFVTVWCTVGITIGPNVSTSDYVALIDTWGRPDGASTDRPDPWPASPIVVAAGAYLGAGAIVGPGVHIGEGAFVGENAVVVDDVPSHSVVYGNPARVTRRLDPGRGWEGEMFP